jgi:hypothetical protein
MAVSYNDKKRTSFCNEDMSYIVWTQTLESITFQILAVRIV